MNQIGFELAILIFLASGVSVMCVCGLFPEETRRLTASSFGLIHQPLLKINGSLESFWRSVKRFYHDQFAAKEMIDTQGVFYQLIGALLYTMFFLAFNYSEFHLLALALVAAGIDAGHYAPPLGAGTLTAFSILASTLFWGAVICDLMGVTRIAPWREVLRKRGRKYLLFVTIFALGLGLLVTVTMGLLRGKAIADEIFSRSSGTISATGGVADPNSAFTQDRFGFSAGGTPQTPEGIYYYAPIIANVRIPILVLMGGIFSSWGLVTIIKFIVLATGFLIISPSGVLLLIGGLLEIMVDRVYQLVDALVLLLTAMGQRLLGALGVKLGGEGTRGENSNENPSDSQSDGSPAAETTREGRGSVSGDEEATHPPFAGWNPYSV